MKPIRSYKDKGLELAVWGKDSYSLKKQYFKKNGDGGKWEPTNRYFKNELIKIREWIDLELAKEEQEPEIPQEIQPQQFSDDEIGF